MFLFVFYFFNMLSFYLIYINMYELLGFVPYVTWLISISIFFLFIIVHTLWNIFGYVTYFDKFYFLLIHQDLKFLKD